MTESSTLAHCMAHSTVCMLNLERYQRMLLMHVQAHFRRCSCYRRCSAQNILSLLEKFKGNRLWMHISDVRGMHGFSRSIKWGRKSKLQSQKGWSKVPEPLRVRAGALLQRSQELPGVHYQARQPPSSPSARCIPIFRLSPTATLTPSLIECSQCSAGRGRPAEPPLRPIATIAGPAAPHFCPSPSSSSSSGWKVMEMSHLQPDGSTRISSSGGSCSHGSCSSLL